MLGLVRRFLIKDFAELIKKIVGFKGKIIFDKSKPDGVYKKVLNTKKVNNLGWNPTTSLESGLTKYYQWYLNNFRSIRR